MRGKVSPPDFRNFITGITPAYAGKRIDKNAEFIIFQDHPRLCGEKWRRKMHVYRVSGSPPPMRGKVGDAKVYGNAWVDHPRLCGEK